MPSDLTPDQIRAAMDALGLTQAQLAAAIGVYQPDVSKALTGGRTLSRSAGLRLTGLLRERVLLGQAGTKAPPGDWEALVEAARKAKPRPQEERPGL